MNSVVSRTKFWFGTPTTRGETDELPRSSIVLGCALPSGQVRGADRARSPVGCRRYLAGSLDDLTVGGFWIAAEGSENLAGATQTVTPGQSRFEPFNFLNIEV
jgi:hypothetical protein